MPRVLCLRVQLATRCELTITRLLADPFSLKVCLPLETSSERPACSWPFLLPLNDRSIHDTAYKLAHALSMRIQPTYPQETTEGKSMKQTVIVTLKVLSFLTAPSRTALPVVGYGAVSYVQSHVVRVDSRKRTGSSTYSVIRGQRQESADDELHRRCPWRSWIAQMRSALLPKMTEL